MDPNIRILKKGEKRIELAISRVIKEPNFKNDLNVKKPKVGESFFNIKQLIE